MKHTSLIICLSAVLVACGSSGKVVTEAMETKLPSVVVSTITVDGRMEDWQTVPRLATPDSTIEYALANNKEDLYVLFKISNPAEQMKLIRGGMEVWFDPTDKHTKATEIIYPVKGELSDETFRAALVPGGKPDMTEMHRHIESGLVSLNRIGFKPEYSGVQSIRENTGFKGAINWDEANALVYEVAIPFAAFPTDTKKGAMEIGFFIGAVDKPKAASGDGATPPEDAGRGMGGSGMRGGGGRRGGGYGGNRQRSAGNGQQRSAATTATAWKKMYEPEAFWVQYVPK